MFYLTFLTLTKKESYFAHSTAVIDEGCTIGEGTKIWHFSHVMPAAEIGKNCNLGQNVFIANGVKLGNNNKIQNNVSVYEGVICEDDVFLGPSMVFTNIKNPRSAIVRKGQYLQTIVKQGASIGANVTIVCGITIGRFAFIGAGSVVTRDVPDYAMVIGNPGRHKGWMSESGQKLFFDVAGEATDIETGEKYYLENGFVSKKA